MIKCIRLLVTLLLMASLSAAVVAAQDDCGDGLPCGKLPWDLPYLPVLNSPTPMPTIAVTQVSGDVGAGTPTPTPAPSITPALELGDFNNQIATLSAVMAATPYTVNDLNGTPVDSNAVYTELGSNAGTFFGYVRSVQSISFGALTPLVGLGFLALVLVISVKLATFFVPLGAAIFGIVRKVVSVVLDFIPL